MEKNKRVLIFSEVDFKIHQGIKRKYQTLNNYYNLNGYKSEVIFNSLKKAYSLIGLHYFKLLIKAKKYEIVYLRNNTRPFAILSFFLLLFYLKLMRIKVVIEIPTWPFINNEYNGIRKYLERFNFYLNRNVYKCINAQVLLCSPNNFSLNLPHKRITNWICDWELKSSPKIPFEHKFNYVYLANMNAWHNPKELLKKFKNCNLSLAIVSSRPFLTQKEIDENLSRNIKIFINPSEIELTGILNNSEIGIDSIGRNEGNYSLKSRDYLSFNLGVIYFHYDDYLDNINSCFFIENFESWDIRKTYSKFIRLKPIIEEKNGLYLEHIENIRV